VAVPFHLVNYPGKLYQEAQAVRVIVEYPLSTVAA
jgi:hypothetical protein